MLYRHPRRGVVLAHAALRHVRRAGRIPRVRGRASRCYRPVAVWGIAIEYGGWICPLTRREHAARTRGAGSYRGGFVEEYVIPALYPAGSPAHAGGLHGGAGTESRRLRRALATGNDRGDV